MAPSWNKLANTLQISADYSIPPAGLQWRSNTFFIIATVAIGLFTDLFLYGLIVPILPYMLNDRLGIPESDVQPYVSGLLTAYAAASVLFSPVAGVLADRVSTRQAPFLLGLLSLLAATVLLFFGNSMAVLVIARVLQGVAAAVVWTIGLALCLETVGSENLGKTIGSIFSFISVGNLVAPILGGVLYDKAGYPGVFGIGFAILAIDFIMRLLVIEKKVAARYETKDPTQGDLDQDLQHERNRRDSANEENGDTEETPLLSKKEQDYYYISPDQPPIVQKFKLLPCLKHPGLVTAFIIAGVQAFLLGAFDATVPTVAQQYYTFSPLKSGLLFLPLGVSDFLLGPVFGWAVDRAGTKPVATFAYLYLVPILILLRLPRPCPSSPSSLSLLASINPREAPTSAALKTLAACADPNKQIATWSALLFLAGAGLAATSAPSIVEAGAIVKKFHERNPAFFGADGPYAQLYGLSSMVFSAGLTVGPLVAGALKERIGYGDMNAVIAAVSGVTGVAAFVWIGGRVGWGDVRRMLGGGRWTVERA
ncbi:Tetracycline resistance protein TetA/multidrug resistance protein MdtG [Lasiodiplodia theobromae]|uniref:Tetracycline resistance protein TetA/multidrug resistance protein MdtG n=1 Tax=Lasiodiplodia theobromae TaxID=45133 RepID=UPI0015C36288|nr:Tetracycline resistance protein TetA/multidrug resistance protein MdtG [Lasiodiplodia theobromae]KAF4543453.1 Tetracycline resistance protein TetA/multidrug resistance protein MdtG [Lasiodiplodia theobromae]